MIMKKLFLMTMSLFALIGLSACSKENSNIRAINEISTINFINNTGEDVGVLKVRLSGDVRWSENLLVDEVWKDSYEMPITLNGEIPKAEDGWEVSMQYLNGDEELWENVVLDNNTTLEFVYEDSFPTVKVSK